MICVVMTLHHDHYLKLLALTCINRVEIKYRHGRESTVTNFFFNLPTAFSKIKYPSIVSFQFTVFNYNVFGEPLLTSILTPPHL